MTNNSKIRGLFLIAVLSLGAISAAATWDYVTGGTTDMTTMDFDKDPLVSKYGGTDTLCGLMWEVPSDRTPWGHEFVVYVGMTDSYRHFTIWMDGVNYLYRWCN